MRLAALILGIIGGIAGIGGAIFALFVGGVGAAFGASEARSVVGLGLAAIPFSILGIVGGALSMSRPKTAGIMMLVAAVGGLISVSWGYVIAFPCLLIGSILALIAGRPKQKSASA